MAFLRELTFIPYAPSAFNFALIGLKSARVFNFGFFAQPTLDSPYIRLWISRIVDFRFPAYLTLDSPFIGLMMYHSRL